MSSEPVQDAQPPPVVRVAAASVVAVGALTVAAGTLGMAFGAAGSGVIAVLVGAAEIGLGAWIRRGSRTAVRTGLVVVALQVVIDVAALVRGPASVASAVRLAVALAIGGLLLRADRVLAERGR